MACGFGGGWATVSACRKRRKEEVCDDDGLLAGLFAGLLADLLAGLLAGVPVGVPVCVPVCVPVDVPVDVPVGVLDEDTIEGTFFVLGVDLGGAP